MQNEKVEVCTTQEAATLLGISVTSVQKLAESGELPGWKTSGGHRRIERSGVLLYRDRMAPSQPATQPQRARLLVVEDNALQRRLYEGRIRQWPLALELILCRSGYEGLIELGTRAPDILVLDIAMRGIDGYELMETVLGRPSLRHIHIAIATSMCRADLDSRGGVPPGVALFEKPVDFARLEGFVTACCMQKQRAEA